MIEEITDDLIKHLCKRKLTIQYRNINKIKDKHKNIIGTDTIT